MKFSTLLVTVAAAALCLFDGSTATPTGLTTRATNGKVIVGYTFITNLTNSIIR